MPLANLLKRNSKLFGAALLVALASSVAWPKPVLAASPQHHDQVPGFLPHEGRRSRSDGPIRWARRLRSALAERKRATIDSVVKALHEDPHMLDGSETGFLVNTGKQLILVDAGRRHLVWWGSARALGRQPPQRRLYAGRRRPRFGHASPLRSRRRPHHSGRTARLSNAEVYVAKAESDFWLSPGIAARAPKDAQPFFRVRKPSQRRISRAASGTHLVAPSQSSTACNSCHCLVIPRDIPAMNFRQRDKKSCFGVTSSIHSASSCSTPR